MSQLKFYCPTLSVVAGALIMTLLFSAAARSTDSQSTDTDVERILKLSADPEYGEYLAAECVTCHAEVQTAGVPQINGLPANYIIRALLEYKNLVRPNEVMKVVADSMGDEEMAALAAHFSVTP